MAQMELPIPGISARDVLRVLFKHRWPILGLYCVIVVVSAILCFFWPPTYEAVVRLLVTHTREEPVISSDQNSVRMLTRLTVTADDLNSEMAIIQSPAVLEKTVRDMKIDTAVEPWYWRVLNSPFVFARSVYDSYHSKPSPTPLVKSVQRLAGKLEVIPEQKSDVIEIRLRWGDPRFAQSALERLKDNFMAEDVQVHKSPSTQDLFLSQMNLKTSELKSIERQIEAIQPGGSIDALKLEREIALKQASDFEAEWRKARAMAAGDRARVDSQSTQLQATPGRVLTADKSVVNQQAIGTLRTQILQLELKRTELLQKYQPNNRLVVEVEDDLAKAKSMLEQELNNTPHEQTTEINKVAQDLWQRTSVSQAELQSNLALEEAMRKEYLDYENRIRGLDRNALLILRLARDKSAVETSLLLYQREYEEARMQDEMNRTGIINVVAIGPVRADPNPVKPNTSLLIKLALGVGLIVAISLGFLLEVLDHRLKSDSDAEVHLGVPVLTALDQYDSAEVQLLEPSV
jgi:uncharacterized protein involved in exopolysaccharide biosynthesis